MSGQTEAARNASLHEQVAVLESQANRAHEEARKLRRENESLRQANSSLQRDFESYRERWMHRGEIIGQMRKREEELVQLLRDYHDAADGLLLEHDYLLACGLEQRMDELGIEVVA